MVKLGDKMVTETLHTKFGNARINQGYYVITSRKEGNNNQALHRLIFEDFYGTEIPKGYNVHHKNGNKLDNCILNLQLLSESEHHRHHQKGKKFSKEHCRRISDAMRGEKHYNYGKELSYGMRKKISEVKTSSGLFRVFKKNTNQFKQGYCWIYAYYKKGEKKQTQISSTDLLKLKQKIIAKGLDWFVVDEKRLKLICDDYNYTLKEVE